MFFELLYYNFWGVVFYVQLHFMFTVSFGGKLPEVIKLSSFDDVFVEECRLFLKRVFPLLPIESEGGGRRRLGLLQYFWNFKIAIFIYE